MYTMVLVLLPLIGLPLYMMAAGDKQRAADEAALVQPTPAAAPTRTAAPTLVMAEMPDHPPHPLATAV
ncbi:MAG: hypothetical protein H7123_02530 [Thermoleophilia bacterium]|nr:hypothetical protein [Thermoleophilia bacterium]